MKRIILFEVRRNGLVLSAFARLIDAVRYWRFDAKKNGSVVRVVIYYDENGGRIPEEEILID